MQNKDKQQYETPDFLRGIAYLFASKGISMLPVDEKKVPTVPKWKPFQEHIPTTFEINAMFTRNTFGIAAITGRVSGNLELLDIDCKYDLTGNLFEGFMELLTALAPELVPILVIAKTMNKGYHILYRCATIGSNIKIASRPATEEELQKKPNEKQLILIETRGEGGYFLCAPTHGYEFIQGSLDDLPVITVEQRELLFSIAASFDLVPHVDESPKFKQSQKEYGLSPFEDYNRRGDCIGLLQNHGWTIAYIHGSKTFLKRPGESKTKQSGNFNADKNWFSVFSSSTVFEICKAYLPYAVFAMLECGGDFGEAAKRLLALGFGEASQSKNSNNNSNNHSYSNNNKNSQEQQDVSHLPVYSFPKEVYENLPPFLKKGCSVFTTEIELGVFLISAIGVFSGCFPNYYSVYASQRTACNLFIFIYGPASAGKATITWARRLGDAIHDYLQQCYEEDRVKYEKELIEYKEELKRTKGQTDMKPPVEPPRRILFIPANASTSAIIETLNANKGRGIIFATEADMLSEALGQEWGNFSTIMRASFHSEPVALLRRKDKEFAEVKNPEASVVISGTPSQVIKLIPNPENGLNSRFCYYEIPMIPVMNDVFASGICFNDFFDELGKLVFAHYLKLSVSAIGIKFDFTPEQKKIFIQEYTISHAEFYKSLGDNSIASIRRLALINFRIAMILSMVRIIPLNPATEYTITAKIICNDIDFENAFRITGVLKENARKLLLSYPKEFVNPYGLKGDCLRFYKALPEEIEFDLEDAMKIADSLNIIRDTAQGYLYNKLVPKKLVQHTTHNKYIKTS